MENAFFRQKSRTGAGNTNGAPQQVGNNGGIKRPKQVPAEYDWISGPWRGKDPSYSWQNRIQVLLDQLNKAKQSKAWNSISASTWQLVSGNMGVLHLRGRGLLQAMAVRSVLCIFRRPLSFVDVKESGEGAGWESRESEQLNRYRRFERETRKRESKKWEGAWEEWE